MFIPIGDDNSRRRTLPVVVWGIFALNCFFWFLELTLGDAFVMAYSVIPAEITRGHDLIGPTVLRSGESALSLEHVPGPSPIYLTLFTAMFMHASWMHIIGNMLYLLIFADQIEDEMGHVKFLFFYLLCGVGASIAHVLVAPSSPVPSLGASGAIAGVLGAYLITHPHNRVRVLMYGGISEIPALMVLGFWVVLQFVGQVQAFGGLESGVAYMAHIGGFLIGIGTVWFFRRRSNFQ